MKAIQVKHPGGPEVLELAELPIPEAKDDEAVVKIAAAGVNFIDVYYREGRYKAVLPFVPGQEGAGEIVAVGPDVKQLKVGDRVAYTMAMGSYAEYAAVPADRLVKIPEDVSYRQAAAAMLQGMTAHYLSHDTYPLKSGETTLVHAAAGGVGLILVQMARNIGVRVIGTASTEEKARLARDAGAHEVILYTQSDFESETRRLTGGHGVEVVYDSVGKTTFEKGLNVLRPRDPAFAKRIIVRNQADAGALYCDQERFGAQISRRLCMDRRGQTQAAHRAHVSSQRRGPGTSRPGGPQDHGEIVASELNSYAGVRVNRFIERRLLITALLLPLSTVSAAQQPTIRLQFDPEKTTAPITLSATLHTVHGKFLLQHGEIKFDPGSGKISGEIVFDATSGKTGNEGRDR
jgi:NADPH2:quinone reductase